jgi:hypothetical protein
MGLTRNAYRILVVDHLGKQLFGTPISRLEEKN